MVAGAPCTILHDGITSLAEPIKSFRRVWINACHEAGIPDLKFHDLCRTAVCNMWRAGGPRSSA
jgi:hypothetical protein